MTFSEMLEEYLKARDYYHWRLLTHRHEDAMAKIKMKRAAEQLDASFPYGKLIK